MERGRLVRVLHVILTTLGGVTLAGVVFFIGWWGLMVRIKHVSAAEGACVKNRWSPL